MATLFVDKVDPQSGTSLEIGSSGDTITIPSGATITNNGTQTGFGGTNTPAFSVRLNSAQNIANSTFVKIAFDAELFDTDSAFASNKFTVPSGEGGNYFFNYGIQYLAYNANRGISSFRKNGTEIQTSEISPLTSSTNPTITGALSLNLSAGDYVEVFVYQNSGSAQDIRGSSSELFTYFGGYKIIT
jgi:hypothetical protein